MSNDKFEIVTDPARCLIRITFRGHWDVQTVQAYKAALLRAGDRMLATGCSQDRLLALVDARSGGAQSQDVVASYKDSLGGEELAIGRVATLVTSALFKRQVERVGISNQRVFTEEAEALAWLFSPLDQA